MRLIIPFQKIENACAPSEANHYVGMTVENWARKRGFYSVRSGVLHRHESRDTDAIVYDLTFDASSWTGRP